MSKFSRSWTQHLKTDKQEFIGAFYKVVSMHGWSLSVPWELLDYKIGEDCMGSVNNKSFVIYRKTKYGYENRMEGNIIEEVNGVTLKIHQYCRANYFSLIVGALFWAFFLYIPILNLLGDASFHFPFAVLVLFVYLPVYALAFWVLYWFVLRKINKLKGYYTIVLNEIEKKAIAGKKYSTQ